MQVNLKRIRDLIPQGDTDFSTGDSQLDERYNRDWDIIGHLNPYYRLFYLIAKEFKPAFSLELGTYRAVAASHLAVGNPDGYVVTVDIHREDKVSQREALAASNHYGNLEYINGWTWDAHVVSRIQDISQKTPIDIFFIDAWHRYDYAIREWNIYRPMLSDEALVICDDLRDAEGATIDMIKFWEEVSDGYENFLLADDALHGWCPMGFVRYVR